MTPSFDQELREALEALVRAVEGHADVEPTETDGLPMERARSALAASSYESPAAITPDDEDDAWLHYDAEPAFMDCDDLECPGCNGPADAPVAQGAHSPASPDQSRQASDSRDNSAPVSPSRWFPTKAHIMPKPDQPRPKPATPPPPPSKKVSP